MRLTAPTPRTRPTARLVLAAPVVVAAALLLTVVPALATPAAAPGAGVGAARAELDAAISTRLALGARVGDLEAREAELRDQLDSASAEAGALTSQIADARRTARRRAVDAYVNGGTSAQLMAFLRSDEIDDAALRTSMLQSQTHRALEAASDFQRMKDQNDPAVAALAVELDEVVRALTSARSDLLQAEAFQADAERALVLAEQAEAEARADAARAEQAASTVTAPPASAPPASTPRAQATAPRPSAPARPVAAPSPPSDGWAQLRQCESGGDYTIVSRSGRYRGAYQFSQSTWDGVARTVDPTWVGRDPASAPPAVQDAMAYELYRQRGSRPWPHCGRYLR